MRKVDCPICGQNETRPWGQENGFFAVRCVNCRTIYVNPRPEDYEIDEANLLGVHKYGISSLDVTYRQQRSKIFLYESRLKKIMGSRFADPVRWLDVGAGYGEFLAAVARLASDGSQLDGVEPMAAKRKATNLVQYKSLDEISGKYDVVSLINVFSHLPDPVTFLKTLDRFIDTGSELLIETGNGAEMEREGYPNTLYLPDHLIFVGKDQLISVLQSLNYQIVETREYRWDTALHAIKAVAKKILGRPARVTIPYTSDFRSLFILARSR